MTNSQTRYILVKALKLLVYLAFFFSFTAIVNWIQAPSPGNIEAITQLHLKTLDGKPVIIKQEKAKKTILYFFAPWCTVCKASIDALNMFADKPNVRVYAIGLDYDTLQELSPYQNRLRVSVLAGDTTHQNQFRVEKYPTVFILDENGKVRHSMVGYASRPGIWLRLLF